MPVKPISARALTMGYIVALLIIAGLSVASHVALEASLHNNEGSAAIINKSGRQRMLSQRIAALAEEWRAGDTNARSDLRAAIGAFETSHDSLIQALQPGLLSGSDARELRALYFRPGALDSEVRGFVADARQVAELDPSDPRVRPPLARVLAEARAPLLTALNDVVSIEQRQSERRITRLENLQWAILAVVLVTLMIEASFIFRPMIGKIIAYTGELLRLAMHDPLTGIANRRSFFERCEGEIARAKRYGRPVSILMIDVDHFKAINDLYGHDGGDAALTAIGEALRKTLRAVDIFGRLGGEEFAVLLVETAMPEARLVAERLRAHIEAMTVHCRGQTIRLTASLGCARLDKSMGRLDDALRHADQLMYRAKTAGRNRVVSDEPGLVGS